MQAQGADGAAYALGPDVVATVLDHGALLLDLRSKYFYLLNPSGWSVVQLFEEGTTFDHALRRCLGWGATDADVAEVRKGLEYLLAEGLLITSTSGGAPDGVAPPSWEPMRVERQAEPLQRVIVSAFDPSIPLAE